LTQEPLKKLKRARQRRRLYAAGTGSWCLLGGPSGLNLGEASRPRLEANALELKASAHGMDIAEQRATCIAGVE